MIKHKFFLAILLLIITASPVFAGIVTARNYHQTEGYHIHYKTYYFGISGGYGFDVEATEKKSKDQPFDAIYHIEVWPSADDNKETKDITEYDVSGTPMAYRKFIVIIESGGTVHIDEQ